MASVWTEGQDGDEMDGESSGMFGEEMRSQEEEVKDCRIREMAFSLSLGEIDGHYFPC